VSIDGQRVTVTVTASVDYLILPGGRSVSTSSASSPADGVTAGATP